MRARGHTPVLDRPDVMGVLVLLLTAAVLFIAANALTGLPWQRTHRVEIAVPDAGKLLKNSDVRIGGSRVGQVLALRAEPRRGDVPAHAVLDVQLQGDVDPLPADTRAEVRLGSVLGGKYLSLVPGKSRRSVPWDSRLPLAQATTTIDIDEAFQIVSPEGRAALRKAVGGLADIVAGRGTDLNDTFGSAARLLPGLDRVLRTLAADDTDLGGFAAGLGRTAAGLRRASADLGPALRDGEATFAALVAADGSLGRAIAEVPGTAADGERALRRLQPVLDDVASLARDLHPAAAVLPSAAHRTAALARTATRAAPAAGSLARPFDAALDGLGGVATDPATERALRVLGDDDLATFGAASFVGLGAIIDATYEAERHCRVASTWMRRLAGVAADGDRGGGWMRMIPVLALDEGTPHDAPAPELHANPYPNEDAEECEAGNEPYAAGQAIGNPPGRQRGEGTP